MEPQTISEQMMYSTILIETDVGSGTGFLFNFESEDYIVPVIFTNKHVVNDKELENVTITFHLKGKDGKISENIKIKQNVRWIFHSNKDLCFCYAMPLIKSAEQISEKKVFYIPITENLIYDNEKLKNLSAIEDVIMVGYPIGLSDKSNNFPIFRRGITSSHPYLDFNASGIGVVDMACFPGSSGSPIFILNESSYSDKKGSINLSKRLIFLGILFAGPTFNTQGGIEIIDIPTKQVPITKVPLMVNLGYYIKANEISEFKSFVGKRIQLEKEQEEKKKEKQEA